MSALMSTGNFPQNLRPGIRAFFGAAYKAYDTKYDKLLDVKQAEARAYEETVAVTTLGLPQVKSEGAPVVYDAGAQSYSTRMRHVQYGLAFAVTEENVEDGIALKVGQTFAENMKLNMMRAREIIAANTYANGFSVGSGLGMEGGDGAALFSNAHPIVGGANLSNVPSSAASLSEAALEQMVIDVQAFKDNRGQLIMVRPDKLIIPTALQFTAERILGSILRSGTNDNDLNALRNLGMLPGGIVVDPYLTVSATNWFVKTDQPGLVFLNRKDISMSDDNEFDTENMKFKALMRFSTGWDDFRAAYGVNA